MYNKLFWEDKDIKTPQKFGLKDKRGMYMLISTNFSDGRGDVYTWVDTEKCFIVSLEKMAFLTREQMAKKLTEYEAYPLGN